MKTRTKLLTGIIAIILSCVIMFTVIGINSNTIKVDAVSASTRTVEVSQTSVDAQSIFDEFENVELTKDDTKISFVGTKQMDLSVLSDIDLIALDETFGEDFKDVTYNVSVDSENLNLEVSLSFLTENDEIVTDTLNGIVVTSETGKADALIFIDGETVLLSELCNEDLLDNVGFFSWLFKTAKNIANKLVKIIQEPIKVLIIAVSPVVKLLGGVLEIVSQPFTAWKIFSNYDNNIQQKINVDKDGYIYNQSQNDYSKWNIGFGHINSNGCGVIATYNALVFTNKIINDADKVKDKDLAKYRVNSFANLIRAYESGSGTLVKGVLGINPVAVAPMLAGYGVKVASYSNLCGNAGFEVACDNLGANQMAILCYWWKSNSSSSVGAHYTSITKSKGTYHFINDSRNDSQNYHSSVSQYLHSNQTSKGFIQGWIVTK